MIRRSPEQWQQLIKTQQTSGMSIAEFCHANNINQSTFYLQRKKRSDIALPQGNSQWLPIADVIVFECTDLVVLGCRRYAQTI